jgi:hypothetical protein
VAANVALPSDESLARGYGLSISGWVLSTAGAPETVRVVAAETDDQPPSFVGELGSIPVNLRRPQVGELHGDVPGAAECGFGGSFSLLGLARDFTLELEGVLPDGARVPFARVRGRRAQLSSGHGGKLRPVLLRAPGRSGSRWLISLLGQHPQIVAYEPLSYEPRVCGYWVEVLRALAEPRSASRAIRAELRDDSTDWWIREGSLPPVDFSARPDLDRWLGQESIEDAAAFCQQRIEGFYERVAESDGKPDVACFAERTVAARVTAVTQELYPQTRQVFLIRDPRDLLASRIAANARWGLQFGRSLADSDEAYVRGEFARQLRSFSRQWASCGEEAFLVRYEDLIERPAPTLGGLFRHLDVDPGEETVESTLDAALRHLPERQRQHMTVTDAARSVGRGPRDLPPELLAACEESLAGVLGELGY